MKTIFPLKYWPNWLIRLFYWEFWPWYVIYSPVAFYYIYLSLKARSWAFFSCVNPTMLTGGLFGASKYNQLQHIENEYKPITLFVECYLNESQLLELLLSVNIDFPLIAKPDIAERGIGVALIADKSQLLQYHAQSSAAYVIQEYCSEPFEAGVFYYKIPGQSSGHISSIVIKEFLKIRGDGAKSIADLLMEIPRARLVFSAIKKRLGNTIHNVPLLDEEVLIEPIGNHNRGTRFLNGNHLINPYLLQSIENIANQIPGFNYGRFDLKAPSNDLFYKGQGLKILEVNGVNSEPAHIYDSSISFFQGLSIIMHHWSVIYQIATLNRSAGVAPIRFSKARSIYKQWKMIKK